MNTYHLFKDSSSDLHYLVKYERVDAPNFDENKISATISKEESDVKTFIAKYLTAPINIGAMEDFPVGDEIYEASNGEKLTLWYSPNTLSQMYLVLGTGESVEAFHAEAIEEYGDMIGKITKHMSVQAIFLKAS